MPSAGSWPSACFRSPAYGLNRPAHRFAWASSITQVRPTFPAVRLPRLISRSTVWRVVDARAAAWVVGNHRT